VIVHTPDKTYDIPRPLLAKYFESLHYNQGFHTKNLSGNEIKVAIQHDLEYETECHKAIFDHLGLDYEMREQFSPEAYVAEAVQAWFTKKIDGKPEIEEITVTNVIETQATSG